MGYVITFSDVMAGAITLGLGTLAFFIKGWFGSLSTQTAKIEKEIEENDKKVNERIDRLEEATEAEAAEIRKELKDVEKDFPLIYVQREDFFRSMNSVEGQMRDISTKLDQLLIQNGK